MRTPSARAQSALHARYVDAVNRAVTDDRDELVAELEEEYERERAPLLRTDVPAGSPAS